MYRSNEMQNISHNHVMKIDVCMEAQVLDTLLYTVIWKSNSLFKLNKVDVHMELNSNMSYNMFMKIDVCMETQV